MEKKTFLLWRSGILVALIFGFAMAAYSPTNYSSTWCGLINNSLMLIDIMDDPSHKSGAGYPNKLCY